MFDEEQIASSLEELKRIYAAQGVDELLVKTLQAKQNSKNQFYFGSGFEILNELPVFDFRPEVGGTHERTGKERLKARLNLSWLDRTGRAHRAPKAQVILYPQYPEVRLGSLISGAEWAPRELLRSSIAGRVLVLGKSASGELLGSIFHPMSEVARELESEDPDQLLRRVPVRRETRTVLLQELKRVWEKGWIRSWRLSSAGERLPCESQNCGGYTLEAELGVLPSGKGEPDFLDWELKQYAGSAITLLTPEPTGGLYVEAGKENFVRQFGYPDKTRPDRLNFSTPHRVGRRPSALSCLRLSLNGYDRDKETFWPNGSVLAHDQEGNVCVEWSFTTLLNHWSRKHAKTAFIPSSSQKDPALMYRFGPTVHLGTGTHFSLFLSALQDGVAYWDPALKLESIDEQPKLKARNQFRIRTDQIHRLYHEFDTVELSEL
jgi:hypothetical protein